MIDAPLKVPFLVKDDYDPYCHAKIVNTLKYLETVVDTVFDAIDERIQQKRAEVREMKSRIEKAQTYINKIKDLKHIVTIVSPLKFKEEEYPPLFDAIGKSIPKKMPEYVTHGSIILTEAPSNSVYQEDERFRFKDVPIVDSNDLHNKSLGKSPEHVNSTTSLLLFNTSFNPYVGEGRSIDNFEGKAITGSREKGDIPVAPNSIYKVDYMSGIYDTFFYDSVADVDNLDLPSGLGLENIVDLGDIDIDIDDSVFKFDLGQSSMFAEFDSPMLQDSVSTPMNQTGESTSSSSVPQPQANSVSPHQGQSMQVPTQVQQAQISPQGQSILIPPQVQQAQIPPQEQHVQVPSQPQPMEAPSDLANINQHGMSPVQSNVTNPNDTQSTNPLGDRPASSPAFLAELNELRVRLRKVPIQEQEKPQDAKSKNPLQAMLNRMPYARIRRYSRRSSSDSSSSSSESSSS